MADRRRPAWKLEGFDERYDMFVERENISPDLGYVVWGWIFTRADDPFKGVQRVGGFENFWWGSVPDSQDGKGHVVVCSYFIHVATNTVACDNFGLLSTPL